MMNNKPGTIARIVKDAFEPKNVGVTVVILRPASPDECVGGPLNHWIVRPSDRTQMIWTATEIDGSRGFWTNGEIGVADEDIAPLCRASRALKDLAWFGGC